MWYSLKRILLSMLFNIEVVIKNKLLNSKLIIIFFVNTNLLPFFQNFDPFCFHMENWDFSYSVTNFDNFYHFFHTLANFQLIFLWKVGVFWQKLTPFRKIQIVLCFKCHVTFRLQTKRTFQTSRIKIKNHSHVTSVSIVSQESKRVLNKYVLLHKSFKWFSFLYKVHFDLLLPMTHFH